MNSNKHGTKCRLCAKSNKAITLIALIITIVVLLILAGITIASITANNSPIDKAGQAKHSAEVQAEMDELQQVINKGSSQNFIHGNFSGSADVNSIKTALKEKNIIEEDVDIAIREGESEFQVTGKKTGCIYIISSNGKLTKVGNLSIGDAINADKYGMKVDYYSKYEEENGVFGWRLFYQDNNYAYLIGDKYLRKLYAK